MKTNLEMKRYFLNSYWTRHSDWLVVDRQSKFWSLIKLGPDATPSGYTLAIRVPHTTDWEDFHRRAPELRAMLGNYCDDQDIETDVFAAQLETYIGLMRQIKIESADDHFKHCKAHETAIADACRSYTNESYRAKVESLVTGILRSENVYLDLADTIKFFEGRWLMHQEDRRLPTLTAMEDAEQRGVFDDEFGGCL